MFLADDAATRALGARLARLLTPGDVVRLTGDLGAGKSTLARGCIQALAGSEIAVPSPTFTLVQPYALGGIELWHVDLYRLRGASEVGELGLDDAGDDVALLIEWPDRLPPDLFDEHLTITLARAGDGRRAAIEATAAWADRVAQLRDAPAG